MVQLSQNPQLRKKRVDFSFATGKDLFILGVRDLSGVEY